MCDPPPCKKAENHDDKLHKIYRHASSLAEAKAKVSVRHSYGNCDTERQEDPMSSCKQQHYTSNCLVNGCIFEVYLPLFLLFHDEFIKSFKLNPAKCGNIVVGEKFSQSPIQTDKKTAAIIINAAFQKYDSLMTIWGVCDYDSRILKSS